MAWGRAVEWFPDSKMARYTRLPSGLVAIARGWLPAMAIEVAAPGFAASTTATRSGMPSDTNARCGVPANTTSAGSSPTSTVRRTRSEARSTMLTESEIWLTTHASPLPRARTLTGSRPTGTDPRRTGALPVTSKTSSRASAVLATRSSRPSGVTSIGCACGDSQLMKEPDCARATPVRMSASVRERRIEGCMCMWIVAWSYSGTDAINVL